MWLLLSYLHNSAISDNVKQHLCVNEMAIIYSIEKWNVMLNAYIIDHNICKDRINFKLILQIY